MMGKISKGGSFGGCVDYVTRKKKDNRYSFFECV